MLEPCVLGYDKVMFVLDLSLLICRYKLGIYQLSIFLCIQAIYVLVDHFKLFKFHRVSSSTFDKILFSNEFPFKAKQIIL